MDRAKDVASGDGMRLVVPVRSPHSSPSPEYFNRGRGITWYNLLSDPHEFAHDLLVCGCPASGEVRLHLVMSDGRSGVFKRLTRNHSSCCTPPAATENDNAPSFAVRVSRYRTASDTVIPFFSSTAVALILIAELIRVCISVLAGLEIPSSQLQCNCTSPQSIHWFSYQSRSFSSTVRCL